MAELMKMAGYAIATVTLATVTLVGIAVVNGFKDAYVTKEYANGTQYNESLIDGTTADLFIAGLTVFGTFMSIISLALVGKIIIGIVREN